jgi:hypothetical protein
MHFLNFLFLPIPLSYILRFLFLYLPFCFVFISSFSTSSAHPSFQVSGADIIILSVSERVKLGASAPAGYTERKLVFVKSRFYYYYPSSTGKVTRH